MGRHRKIDEDFCGQAEEEVDAADHVVERFFAQQERGSHDLPRKPRPAARGRRTSRPGGSSGPDESKP